MENQPKVELRWIKNEFQSIKEQIDVFTLKFYVIDHTTYSQFATVATISYV